jgi:hypothetical protein
VHADETVDLNQESMDMRMLAIDFILAEREGFGTSAAS